MVKILEVKFYELTAIDYTLLKYAVIVSTFNGKWVYCKHKERETWEIAGGHIERGETPLDAAKRELHEETGAIEFSIEFICVYSVKIETESYGLLCYAEISRINEFLNNEIREICLFDSEPNNLTYPGIQPKLLDKVKDSIRSKKHF